ncbi:MAG TPA: hypothetical protein VGM64_04285 [Lacunisphaera sp.]|jgi:hypothetical protein
MKTPPTLVYTHGGGRLGNQIIRHAHWLAWARAHAGRVSLVNVAFWPYVKFFENGLNHPGGEFPPSTGCWDGLARSYTRLPSRIRMKADNRSRLGRMMHAVGRYWPSGQAIALDDARGECIDLGDEAFFSRVAAHRITTVSGWKIASWRLVAEQATELREYFRPAHLWAERAHKHIADLRQNYDLLIGVLVRQGDYREWDGGRFYFPTAHYVTWLRQLVELHPGRRLAFVVASDEWQDPRLFTGLPFHFTTGAVNSGGPWFESWVELSLCDLILSPPSTFSATASFLGAVPLWPLCDANQTLAFAQIIPDNLVGAAKHPVFSISVN